MPKKYMKPKAHAFLCQLYNIRPFGEQPWSRNQDLIDEIIGKLTDLSAEQKLFARFKVYFNSFVEIN